ncbi:hypothetical protein ACGFZR_15435 [Streptomyces sp. NPDC048241]|uniref:hypothetical protein n=1 Tax=Streptomyces sp. NPDC048241 TaxID=3365521 RepID=UPI003719E133
MRDIPAAVVELLHAGYGDRTIATRAGVTIPSVTAARTTLGLPKARRGVKPATTIAEAFWRGARDAGDGHYTWGGFTNESGTPFLHWNGHNRSALRAAHRIQHGTEPTGYAFTTCTHPGCVAPAHIGDTATAPRPAHHHKATGRKPNCSREDIVTLLRAGLSDSKISKRLHTNPVRVATIRAELGLPVTPQQTPITFEDRWAASTEPTRDGHLRWIGRHKNGAPIARADSRELSPRRAAFERLYKRPATGRVLPGCGWGPCVKPEHLEDQTIRTQYTAIFGDRT